MRLAACVGVLLPLMLLHFSCCCAGSGNIVFMVFDAIAINGDATVVDQPLYSRLTTIGRSVIEPLRAGCACPVGVVTRHPLRQGRSRARDRVPS